MIDGDTANGMPLNVKRRRPQVQQRRRHQRRPQATGMAAGERRSDRRGASGWFFRIPIQPILAMIYNWIYSTTDAR
jgi:hypothetical protein